MNNASDVIIYQTEDGQTKIDVRMENETTWLTQMQISELFQRDRTVITKHIKNVFAEKELDEKSNVQYLHIANSEWQRKKLRKSNGWFADLDRSRDNCRQCLEEN